MKKGHIIMLCGLPGVGKTTYAKQLVEQRNVVRLCPDEWIVSLLKNAFTMEKAHDLRHPTEQTLLNHAITLANQGIDALLENGFWTVKDRNFHKNFIKKRNIDVELVFMDAPLETLWERINKRNTTDYAFNIDLETLKHWQTQFEPPTEQEGKDYSSFQHINSK
jgi:predicted kinase